MAAVSPWSPSRSTAAGSRCKATATTAAVKAAARAPGSAAATACGRHWHAHLVRHLTHAQPDDDAEHQRTPDHLNVIETTLQKEVRQQGVRTSAS